MTAPLTRRGITLLEVLIAIGVLAIGLTSVVALVPAGRSQASRAVILDRAANLGANAAADAVTFGLLKRDALHNAGNSDYMFDPFGAGSYLRRTDHQDPPGPPLAIPLARLKRQGVYALAADDAVAPNAVTRLFSESRDDIVVNPDVSADDPPLSLLTDGVWSFSGRMSCIIHVTPAPVPRLSVVVFHARDASTPAIEGQVNGLQLTIPAANLAGRRFRDVVKPGVVLWDEGSNRFRQATTVTLDPSGNQAFVSLTGGDIPNPTIVQVLPDSVGLVERVITLETTGPYSR
jgi:hypothetical protein